MHDLMLPHNRPTASEFPQHALNATLDIVQARSIIPSPLKEREGIVDNKAQVHLKRNYIKIMILEQKDVWKVGSIIF